MSTIRDQISDLIQTARDVACWENRNTAENALANALTMATIGLGTLFEPAPSLKVPAEWGSYTVRIAFDDGTADDYTVRADTPDAARARAVQRAAFTASRALWGREVRVIDSGRPSEGWLQAHPLLEQRHGVDDRVVNEVCDNCGSPLVVVRSRAGRFCTSECAEAFELS